MTRFFDDMNRAGGAVCPICKTDAEQEVLLVPKRGTEQGNIVEAAQVHRDCAFMVGHAYYFHDPLEAVDEPCAICEQSDGQRYVFTASKHQRQLLSIEGEQNTFVVHPECCQEVARCYAMAMAEWWTED